MCVSQTVRETHTQKKYGPNPKTFRVGPVHGDFSLRQAGLSHHMLWANPHLKRSFLRSPHLDVWELLKQAAHGSPQFPIEGKKSVCVKKFASCFGNSYTSKSGLRRIGYPIKMGIRSQHMVRQTNLSQRKISLHGTYSKRFWIRPIHFFCAFHEPFVKRSPHLKGCGFTQI